VAADGKEGGVLEETHDSEELIQRVAALDIGKAQLVCCVRVPNPDQPGKRLQEVRTYPTMTRSLLVLADRLRGLGVTRVVMEATSDYWKPPFYLLEAHGLEVWLVNAKDVKHLPGRPKTDRLDAVWLSKLTERGMLRPSFVPPGRDPPAAGLHPAAGRPDPRAHPVLAAAGEAAGGRPGQGVVGGEHAGHGLDPGHARGAHRRGA
jgi:hypothetical protein